MLFRIEGEIEKVEPCVKEFCEMAEKEWARQMPGQREKLKKLKLPLPVSIPNPENVLPDEMLFVHWVEDGFVWMRVPVYVPLQRVFGKARKQAKKNLEGFLKAKGLKVKVKYMGD